jgi:hypothetical protein
MLRGLLPLLLLAPARDEADNARAELVVAVQSCDRLAVDRAAAKLAKLDQEKCAGGFAEAFRKGIELLSDLEKERDRAWKEMKLHEVVKDDQGRYLKGDPPKYFAAKKQYDPLALKCEQLHAALPHMMTAHLTRLASAAAAKGLADTLRGANEWLTRAACAEALGKIEEPAALEALLARAKNEDFPNVRVALADALGMKAARSEEARRILTSWTDSPFWQIRISAAHALARSGDRGSAFTLINMLVQARGREKTEVNEALRKLTGVDKAGDHAAWKAWWEENREAFLEGRYSARATERPGQDPGMSTFYGIAFNSTRVVFAIDMSTSMIDPTGWRPDVALEAEKLEGDRAIDVAKYELRKIIRRMPDDALYNVVGIWGALSLLEERMVRSTKAARERSIKWVNELQLKSGTDLFGAIARGMEWTGGQWNAVIREDAVDTIYLLSDGQPTVGLTDRAQVVERTLDTARYKKVVIHVIAVGAPAHGRILLKAIADGTGGTYALR